MQTFSSDNCRHHPEQKSTVKVGIRRTKPRTYTRHSRDCEKENAINSIETSSATTYHNNMKSAECTFHSLATQASPYSFYRSHRTVTGCTFAASPTTNHIMSSQKHQVPSHAFYICLHQRTIDGHPESTKETAHNAKHEPSKTTSEPYVESRATSSINLKSAWKKGYCSFDTHLIIKPAYLAYFWPLLLLLLSARLRFYVSVCSLLTWVCRSLATNEPSACRPLHVLAHSGQTRARKRIWFRSIKLSLGHIAHLETKNFFLHAFIQKVFRLELRKINRLELISSTREMAHFALFCFNFDLF